MINTIFRIGTIFSFTLLLALSPVLAMEEDDKPKKSWFALKKNSRGHNRKRLDTEGDKIDHGKKTPHGEKPEPTHHIELSWQSDSNPQATDSEFLRAENLRLLEENSRLREMLADYVARGFCYIIEKHGVLVATREPFAERDNFLETLPETFYQGLYCLIRDAYAEKHGLETMETTQKSELLRHHLIKSHDSMVPILIDKQKSIDESFLKIAEAKSIAGALLPRLYVALLEKNDNKEDEVWPLMLNMFGLRALADIEHNEGRVEGRYVVNDEHEQEVYRTLRIEMIKMLALNGHGTLEHENFWNGHMSRNRSSPIAAHIYLRLMRFLQSCAKPADA